MRGTTPTPPTPPLPGQIVSIDNATGDPCDGGRDAGSEGGGRGGWKGNEFNLSTRADRQAGSTFKTIVLVRGSRRDEPWATRDLSAPFYYAPLQWRVRPSTTAPTPGGDGRGGRTSSRKHVSRASRS